MFSLKKKLDINLHNALKNKLYKNYRVIIHCKALQNKVEQKLKTYRCEIIRSIPSIGCICSTISSGVIEKLIELPQIDYITFDTFCLLCGNSVLSANGIAFEKNYKLTGKNIGIGIIDTGVYPHPDLKKPGNRIVKFLDLINNFNYPYDDNGHGTFISGIIASSGESSNGMYKGVAEKSNIYMIKAFNKIGRGYISDILFALETLINESSEHNIRIICLPFEMIDYNESILALFSNLFYKAIEKNIIIIVPSGHNSNVENSMRGIALLKNCITVGGIDDLREKRPFLSASAGNTGKAAKPDLCAVCVDICSLNSDTNYISERNGQKIYPRPLETLYTNYTGTSCSAAFLSGVCALLLENNPDLTYKDIVSLLKISCNLLNIPKNLQGAGIIDIKKLLP
ncbi:serine protease AprX [Clostridium homopropionicum DSM 5847]|uniref:Serine protease AprX n=1 Tax=Clostridium homopropionicum DSM 5847 TaxID=1121318 RepID=A0A0L6Z891_9CLOT|nr:S8 family serine peptidase [Clostridium homopropionicum]KOA19038.1 serine protease AprX [Clostridium homopropionicum DSM 5847]SFG91446.1 Subtilase family protein [Clostridium homopropionicum]